MDARMRSGLVWILSGLFLLLYSVLGLLGAHIPGVEELVLFAEGQAGMWLYVVAGTAMFIEGLYLVGNLLPGSTLVIMLAMLAGMSNQLTFIYTIIAVFVGWTLAGVVNIGIGLRLRGSNTTATPAKHQYLTTWYPTFRANHEVAEVVRGAAPMSVWWSSLKVKVVASAGAALYVLILPYFFDLSQANNKQGFATVLVIGCICVGVGGWEIYKRR